VRGEGAEEAEGADIVSREEADLEQFLEGLAAAFHSSWVMWSKELAETENLSGERLERWRKCWIPYDSLSEEMKELDREQARIAFVMIGMREWDWKQTEHLRFPKGTKEFFEVMP
jgi:hypothetical protein